MPGLFIPVGCGICVFAMCDRVLPPIFFWVLFSTTWFLLNGAAKTIHKYPMKNQPDVFLSFGVVALCLLASGILGPLPFLVLLVPPSFAFYQTVSRWRTGSVKPAQRTIAAVGCVACVVAAFGIGETVQVLMSRTPGQYIVKWSGTGPGNAEFERLRRLEPASLVEYRHILANGRKGDVGEAAERIGELGRYEIDHVELERALTRNPHYPFVREKISRALEQLRAKR